MPAKERTTLESYWSPIFGVDGQDIISQLFSDEDLKCVLDTGIEMLDIDTSSDLEISEKCYITICSMPDVHTPNLSTAVDYINMLDFDKFRYMILNPENEKEWDNYEGNFSKKDFFSNEKYYNMFCMAASLTDEEKTALDTYKSQILNGEEGDGESILFLFKNERIKDFIITIFAAMHNNNSFVPFYEASNHDEVLGRMRKSKAFVKTFKEKYDIWEGGIADINKQVDLLGASFFLGKLNNDQEARQLAQTLFLTYYEAYSDNWKKALFEDRLREQCNNPVNALKFANALKSQKYCKEFCREYEDYIEEKGIRPLFNTRIVVPVIPDLETDKDESHKNWFVEVDRVKAKDGKKKSLYNALYSLYEWLKGEGYISEKTSVDLFIYRFSGYLAPKPLEHKISWNGNMNVLAFIFKCLYTRKDGGSIIKPPYKKLSEFFIPELSNGSQLAGSLDRKKQIDIIQKLELFGFKNVNPSEIK